MLRPCRDTANGRYRSDCFPVKFRDASMNVVEDSTPRSRVQFPREAQATLVAITAGGFRYDRDNCVVGIERKRREVCHINCMYSMRITVRDSSSRPQNPASKYHVLSLFTLDCLYVRRISLVYRIIEVTVLIMQKTLR